MKHILYLKKIFFYFFIISSFLCIGAGEVETKEYAFFAESYEEAEKIATTQGGKLVSFCQGIGVLRKRNIENVKSGVGEKSIKLYPDEVFTVEDIEIQGTEKVQWHLDVLEAESAWETSTGAGVTVAVIDSGIDGEHEDLKEGIVYKDTTIPESEYGVGQRFEEAYRGSEDYFGHGTHVAGIIGARANGIGCTGIAPDCKIISIKALEKQGSTGKGKTSWVASAIRLAIEQGADIINLSLGGSSVKNELLYTVIKEAWEKNIPVVCAAGNITGKQTIFYPGAYEETIAVSAVKAAGDYVDFASSFSNYGEWIDISAPGSSIMSTIRGGYGTKSGTSMACPVVAGGLALLLEEKENLSIEELCNLLYSSSTDLGEKGKDDKYGHGVINLNEMLQKFKNEYIDLLPVVEFEDNSTIRKGVAIHINSPKKTVKVIYTIDGSIPNEESPVYPAEGIIFPEETEIITINSRCIMEDGSLGTNVSTTYRLIEGESTLGKKGEREEWFPKYGNYIEGETGYPYKRYKLNLRAGESVCVRLAGNDFNVVLGLYDSPELKSLLKAGSKQENGDAFVEWKNNSKKDKTVYAAVLSADLTANLGEITYRINWEIKKTKNKEESEDKKAENQEGTEESQNTWTEETQEETSVRNKEEQRKTKEGIEEKVEKEQKSGLQEKKDSKSEIKQGEMVYEEDWLYTMEDEDKTTEETESIKGNSVGEQKEEGEVQQGEESDLESREWQKTQKFLFLILGFGILVEILVIIWNIYGKKKDKKPGK